MKLNNYERTVAFFIHKGINDKKVIDKLIYLSDWQYFKNYSVLISDTLWIVKNQRLENNIECLSSFFINNGNLITTEIVPAPFSKEKVDVLESVFTRYKNLMDISLSDIVFSTAPLAYPSEEFLDFSNFV